MDTLYQLAKFLHIMSFVFMSIPLFNLIVVNERAQMGAAFNYSVDRYFENIIRRGALRCFVFQATVLASGLLLLMIGPLGVGALFTNWVVLLKTLLLIALFVLLSYVHFGLQPKIEAVLANIDADSPLPNDFGAQLKPYRVMRKRLATFCLFLVVTTIILGLQVYARFNPILTVVLIALAGLFSWRVNKTLIRFGWV